MKSPDEVLHPRLWCRTLGGLNLYADRTQARPLMEAGKPLAVLVYLALAPKNKAGRDHVAELLWPGCELHDARHSLRQTLYRLREATGGIPLVRAHGTELELLPAVALDCLAGERHAADGQGAQAYELLRGNFLEGFSIPESVEFESWAEAARTRFRDSWARTAQRLVEEHLRSGDGAHALEMAEELAGLRPLSDDPTRLVMTALAETNRHATAVSRFRAYAELLKRELDTQPGEEIETYARELEEFLKSRPEPSAAALPFVGRSKQWATLEEAWRGIEQGRSATVLVEGAAGFGKTRMLGELAARVRAAGGLVLSAKCYEIERAVPYAVVGEALSGAAARPELDRVEPAWLADAARLLPELDRRFARAAPPVGSAVGHAAKRRLHEGVARCVEALAAGAPVLLSVDDIHWADGPSLEVLHFLSHRLRSTRTLLVGTYRPAELNPAARQFARSLCAERLADLVLLEPLTAEHVCELLVALGRFDSAERGSAVAEHLHRHTGGNPLFLHELLGALERGKVLAVRDGVWRAAPNADVADLPRTLGKLMADRVDGLSPWMRACVEALAVGGQEATVEVLAQALQVSEPRAELALGVLEEERLVRRVGPGAFDLVHDELRRLVYQGILDDRRRILHGAVGGALEGLGEAKRPGGAARLAYHFDQGGDRERAHRYALLAAGEAGALAGPEAGRVHLELAEAHAPKALPPRAGSGRGSWRWLGQPRRAGIAAAMSVVLVGGVLVGGLYMSSTARAARGSADFRQGTLFLKHPDVLSGATHRLRWPSASDTLGAIEALRGTPPGSPPTLLHRDVTESNETHSKVFVARGTDTVQLTFGLSDDMGAEWTPDGAHFLLVRGWRASATRYQQNAFLVDSAGRLVRPLTDTRYHDTWAAWSPTGTRLAFNRDSAGVSAIWMADADGEDAWNVTERFALPRTAGRASFAPREDRLAVVYPDTGSGFGVIYVLDLADTVARPLVAQTRGLDAGALWSPDGQWLAYLTRRGERHALWVVRADGTAGPVLAAVLPSTLWLSAWHAGQPKYAANVVIEPATVSLRSGFGRRVEARVSAPDGAPLVTVVRWSVADTSVASVDELGFVRGRAPGTTLLVASAGGFRADTATVNVSFAPVDTLLLEDWSGGLDTTRWIPFGYPRSVVIPRALPDGRAAFFNNGDYNHGSGAVSAQVFDVGEDGFTIEVEAGIRFTGMHWQIWGIYLHPHPFSEGGTEVGGGPVGFGSTGHSPTIAVPLRDCGGRAVPDRGLMQARWRRVVLVVRPDGWFECWADGRLLGKTELPAEVRGVPLHLVLRGHSVGTRLYHGRVVVRRGVGY